MLTEADGTTVLSSFDDVQGVYVPPTTGPSASVIWVVTPGGTFLSPTSFLVPGNMTAEYGVGNRVRLTLSGGFTYGVVSARTFSSPNTIVTIINDGVVLNSSLSVAEYSVLIAAGETVDAGAVSYFDAMPYSTANTTGWKIKQVITNNTASEAVIENQRARDQKVWTTSGTGTITLTPTPAITSYTTDMRFTIMFSAAQAGASTININGVGAVPLQQYNSSGVLGSLSTALGQVTDIAYNGSAWVVLDPLPAAAATVPHGMQVITSTGSFTVPANVTGIKVTAVGGGGGGGGSYTVGDIESGFTTIPGGAGGYGGSAWTIMTTTPGTVYTCTIGAGGAGSSGTGTTGGSTTFGVSLVQATGGAGGTTTSNGGNGTGTAGTILQPGGAISWSPYGQRGVGTLGAGTAGSAGAVVVEW